MGEAELYAGRRREADDVTNLNQINSQRQLLRVFGGLNEGYACSEAELSEEKNFTRIPGPRDPQAPAEGAGSSWAERDVPSERSCDRGRHDPALRPG